MLLEMALAEFSDERDWNVWSGSSSPDPGESPVDSPPRQLYQSPYERGAGSRLDWMRHDNDVELRSSSGGRLQDQEVSANVEEEQVHSSRSHIQEVSVAGREEPTLNRVASKETFYWEEAAAASVPFEWEDSPRGNRMVQESRSFGRSSHPESLHLSPISASSPRSFRTIASPIRGAGSPIKGVSGNGIGGKMKSILSGRGPTSNVKEDNFAAVPERTAMPAERGAPDFPVRHGREDVDPVQSDSSDDGEGTSPVSTLDLPMSPLTPSYSSQQQGPPQLGQESSIRRQQAKLIQARPTPSSHWTNTLMSEELPAVMEEDEEEDVESVYGYHTMEFQAIDSSPSTSEDRRMSGRDHVPSKSWSAPPTRQNSSLRPPVAQSRGRRRSDFDWPEDFEERPEEVVKEVDESLWAFSPVNSTFVFSGNDNNNTADSRSRSPGGFRVNGGLTPPSSSPGFGSLLESIAIRASLGRSSSSKPGKSTEGEYPRQRSSRLRQHNINGDDDYDSGRGHPMKRSYSCLYTETHSDQFFTTSRPHSLQYWQLMFASCQRVDSIWQVPEGHHTAQSG